MAHGIDGRKLGRKSGQGNPDKDCRGTERLPFLPRSRHIPAQLMRFDCLLPGDATAVA